MHTLHDVAPAARPVPMANGFGPGAAADGAGSDGWLGRWCATDSMTERLAAINVLARQRLSSRAAAEVWLHLMGKTDASVTPTQMEGLLRQFLLLAPEHPKAGALYDLLMNGPSAGQPQPEIVFMVTSCERYLTRAEAVLRELQARGAEAVIVIGDPALPVAQAQDSLVALPVADSYEALPMKVLEGLAFLRRRHGPGTCLVKVDDDMRFSHRLDPQALAEAARHRHYVGHPIGPLDCDRCWHLGKTSTPTPVYSRRSQAHFAKGAMYALGPRAIEHLVREWLFYPGEFAGYLYEDRATGAMLQRAGIDLSVMSLDEMGVIFEHQERYVSAH